MVHSFMNTSDEFKTNLANLLGRLLAEDFARDPFNTSVSLSTSVATLPDDGSWKIDRHGIDAANILRVLKLRKTHARMLAICDVLENMFSEDNRDDLDW